MTRPDGRVQRPGGRESAPRATSTSRKLRQRVDHRDMPTPCRAAGGLIRAGIEFTAGMQRRHDDFERRFLRKLFMRIDRNAAAIVGDGQPAASLERHVDPGGMAGDRFVHRVVDDFGEQMMQRCLVGAPDIHAGTPADRLQPLEHLDRSGGVAGLTRRATRQRQRFFDGDSGPHGADAGRRTGGVTEEVAIFCHRVCSFHRFAAVSLLERKRNENAAKGYSPPWLQDRLTRLKRFLRRMARCAQPRSTYASP